MTPGSDNRSSGSDLRERLVEAALEILQEPETPLDLRKVAERAGKSRTAPYLVFGKESEGGGLLALRIAVAAEGAREMAARMDEAGRGVDDPIEALRRVALAFLDFVGAHGRLFRLMYGPEINAVQRVGAEGFREHPEFRALLDFRGRAGGVVSELIHRGQERALLRPEPHDSPDGAPDSSEHPGLLDTPRARYLQIAWASMIGVALLRDDQLLQAVGWHITPEQGARLIVESVFGLDPQRLAGAAASFLASEPATDRGAEATTDRASEPATDRGAEAATDRGAKAGARRRLGRASEPDSERAPEAAYGVPDEAFEEVFDQAVAPDDEESSVSILREQTLDVEAGPMAAPPAAAPPVASPLGAPSGPPGLPEPPPLTETLNRNAGLRRAAFSDKIRNRARILWIDDHPEGIEHEVETLRRLGAEVRVVRNTHGAIRALQGEGSAVQVIVSDIARGSRRDAGVRALPELRRLAPGVPVVFFVADYDPTLGVPDGAAGITNRTDELLHLVVDALEGR